MLYYMILVQIISIIAMAYILRYDKMFSWKRSWVVSFGLISITFIMFKTSDIMDTQFTMLEWLIISFINAIGWHMCFYSKRSLIGLVIMFLTPAIILGSMF